MKNLAVLISFCSKSNEFVDNALQFQNKQIINVVEKKMKFLERDMKKKNFMQY